MNTFLRHTIILFALLISFFQSAHIISHVCLDHEKDSKELIQFTDHKCNLCTNQVQFTIPDYEFEPFVFEKINTKQSIFVANEKSSKNYTIQFRQLRAPPFLI